MTVRKSSLIGAVSAVFNAILITLCSAYISFAGDRPVMPVITRPVMFNTEEADRILAALQVFPSDNPWNEDISRLPVLKNSGWECACAAIFDLKSNRLRPDGWTSSDAAGLPIFPAIIRFDMVGLRSCLNHRAR